MRRAALLVLALLALSSATPAAPVNGARTAESARQPAIPVRLPAVRMHGVALDGTERRLSVDQIDRLAPTVTWTLWDPYRGRDSHFSGIRLADLVKALAPKARMVRMRAVNDYVTEFGREEWERLPILLATRDGGLRMAVADKGPARVVFQQTRDTEMQMQVYAPKWIWQVVDVEFIAR